MGNNEPRPPEPPPPKELRPQPAPPQELPPQPSRTGIAATKRCRGAGQLMRIEGTARQAVRIASLPRASEGQIEKSLADEARGFW